MLDNKTSYMSLAVWWPAPLISFPSHKIIFYWIYSDTSISETKTVFPASTTSHDRFRTWKRHKGISTLTSTPASSCVVELTRTLLNQMFFRAGVLECRDNPLINCIPLFHHFVAAWKESTNFLRLSSNSYAKLKLLNIRSSSSEISFRRQGCMEAIQGRHCIERLGCRTKTVRRLRRYDIGK